MAVPQDRVTLNVVGTVETEEGRTNVHGGLIIVGIEYRLLLSKFSVYILSTVLLIPTCPPCIAFQWLF